MATKSPSTNLLSKFGQLFRKSGNDDADSEAPPDGLEHDYLTHKQREDTARTHELNQLRNVIRDNRGITPQGARDVAALASTNARNSDLGALERNSILGKIDSAEAHLEQWWGPGTGHSALSREPEAPAADNDLDLDFTGMMGLSEDAIPAATPAPQPVPQTEDPSSPTPLQSGLCNAALMYAEGEFLATETILRALLADPGLGMEESDNLSLALFDVYRCSGQQDRFDALALDYANRFGRSPAEWFSLSDTVAQAPHNQEQQPWQCPALLDTQALADLLAHQPDPYAACAINWQPLQRIDPGAAHALAKQVAHWCESPVKLQWLGVGSFMAALHICKTSGDASQAKPWWLIQLDVLCILQQIPAFEELALEYCVTFEESPPSWKSVVCTLATDNNAQAASEFVPTMPKDSSDAGVLSQTPYAIFELSGNITGDNPRAVRELHETSHSVNLITVSCARLGRIDMQAAKRILDWAQECQNKRCEVQFRSLPRLVLAYFHMLGMEKWASLSAGSH